MNALIFSTMDNASMNVLNQMKEYSSLIEKGECCNNVYYEFGNFYIFVINENFLYANNIDERIKYSSKIDFENYIFISKHKSETGIKCLTVHPFGNFGKAEMGGKDYELIPVNSRLLTGLLLKLNEYNTLNNFNVNFEVTHHGPYIDGKGFFIEIGSSDEDYKNKDAGKILMKSIMDGLETNDNIISIGIGGGHYAPRFTKLAITKKVSFGHMAPKYHAKDINENLLIQMFKKSNARYLIMEKKDLNSSERKRILDILSIYKDFELLDPDSLEERS
ncbi:MAG: D-aminoacyl-tRNA deacylase [Thermoplasmata archaeon]